MNKGEMKDEMIESVVEGLKAQGFQGIIVVNDINPEVGTFDAILYPDSFGPEPEEVVESQSDVALENALALLGKEVLSVKPLLEHFQVLEEYKETEILTQKVWSALEFASALALKQD